MIYLDYNATTPLCDAAREAMLPYLGRYFGNPSSVHAAGREARAAIDNARDKLGALLRAKPGEIIFTGGATESCNLAVLGLARSSSSRGGHIISNKAEHHAVLHPLEHLEQHEGFEVTWLNVSESGMVDLDQLADSIRPDTKTRVDHDRQQRDRRDPADARNLTDMPRPRRLASQRHGPGVRENGCRCLSRRCREFCRAQVLWTKRYRLSLSSRAAYRSSQSCSGAHTKISGAPGQKTWLASREWLPPRNGYCTIARRSRNAEPQLRDQLWRSIVNVFPGCAAKWRPNSSARQHAQRKLHRR